MSTFFVTEESHSFVFQDNPGDHPAPQVSVSVEFKGADEPRIIYEAALDDVQMYLTPTQAAVLVELLKAAEFKVKVVIQDHNQKKPTTL